MPRGGLPRRRYEHGIRMVESENKPPSVPRRSGFAWAALAVLSCPCHVPLLALLFAGTAAGAFLNEQMGSALALMVIVFLPSLGLAIKRLNESGPASRATSDECGECERNGRKAESRAAQRAARNVS